MSLRIMVVDDSQATRRVVSALVGSRWTVCGSAENGKTALKKFVELKPDLVLLDLGMPGMNGRQVLEKVRAAGRTLPVIVFSGYSELEVAREFEGLQIASFLQKPFSTARLAEEVSRVMDRKSPARQVAR